MALSTQIPMQVWEDAGPKAQATAWQLLEDLQDDRKGA